MSRPAAGPARVTAVVPTRGRLSSLLRTLDSIRAQAGPPVELVVVDDASDPPLPPLPADVTVVRFAAPAGACAARNAGVARAAGELLLFLDDDAEFDGPDRLARAVGWFARPDVAAVGFRQLTPARAVHYMQPVAADVPVRTGVFFSYGCVVRRSAYAAVGGMDERFQYYYEEIDLSLRLFAGGHGIVYDPGVTVVHHQDDRHRDPRRIGLLTTRNACLSYLTHYPLALVPPLLLKRLYLHARLDGRRVPRWADVRWLAGELARLAGSVRRSRRPLPWAAVRGFHRACGRAFPLDPAPNPEGAPS